MKVIIAGGRDYHLTDADREKLDKLKAFLKITEVVSGRARGADTGGEEWAKSRGLPVKPFEPDYKKYKKRAPLVRNKEMAVYADAVVLFPGGRGTADMRACAEIEGIKIFDWR